MKKLLLFIILQLMVVSIAYNQSIDMDVSASAGNSFADKYVSMDWTLGEPVTEFISDDNNSLSNGFQQAFDIIENCGGYCYTLTGFVHADEEYLQNGTVLVIDSTYITIDSMNVLSGNFIFEQIQPGKILFLAKPKGTEAQFFEPTYYVNKLSVQTANPILVGSDIGNIDIHLVKIITAVDLPVKSHFSFVIYPNPANDILFIKDMINVDVSISDLSGRKLLQFEKLNGGIDISGLKAGIYLVHIKYKEKAFVGKFIKQ